MPQADAVLAVCAHPDDETFGLGALLAGFADRGAAVSLLCFTRGEASTLGLGGRDLGELRVEELRAATRELGVGRVELGDHPDGRLGEVPLELLAGEVASMISEVHPDLLLVFDEGGISGHPDHRRATEVAVAAADSANVPVLAWTLPEEVAATLNAELGTSFIGRGGPELDLVVEVDRARQRKAISAHRSQSSDNPVLWRRLELQGSLEVLRWLRPPSTTAR
ncbi:MAG TPA: PIG-L deacetylase family protein [Acidimicrobiales bacterium]|nr:PIG-L deacetylase family protein [Acidimicrobiales bacterium]